MKKVMFFSFTVIFAAVFSSCGQNMYKTYSAGKDNISNIIVLKESGHFDNVSVVVDGDTHTYGKVYKVKAKRKAQPVITEPGKHHVKVIVNGNVIVDENVFLGLQETKIIVLR